MLRWEVTEGEHVFPGVQIERSSLGEAIHQCAGQIVPAGLEFVRFLLGEHRAGSQR
ncbi:hypothetical protein IFHNHDMJ_00841 [Synechococcus sp. CBW1107]|nr:hypothetical protein IFHNHDMJ_00841 [Synechococcus sp. CBW1107]